MNKLFKIKLLILPILIGSISYGQDTIKTNSSWHFKVEPNILFPHMKGKAGSSSALPTVEVDQKAGDFLKHLKFAGMISAEAENENWVITADLLYASLEENVKKAPILYSGKLTAKELMIEAGLLRKIYPWLEAGVSLNLVNLNSSADINVINPTSGNINHFYKSISKTWIDPMIVVRTKSNSNSNFLYSATGKIGGFGIGSDLVWEVEGLLGYRFNHYFYAMGGYQYMSIDYKSGNNNSYLKYDMDTFGPMIKLGININ